MKARSVREEVRQMKGERSKGVEGDREEERKEQERMGVGERERKEEGERIQGGDERGREGQRKRQGEEK